MKATSRRDVLRAFSKVLEAVREFGHDVESIEQLAKITGLGPGVLLAIVPTLHQLADRLPGESPKFAKEHADNAAAMRTLDDWRARELRQLNEAREENGRLSEELAEAHHDLAEAEIKINALAQMFDGWLAPIGRQPADPRELAALRMARNRERRKRGDSFHAVIDEAVNETINTKRSIPK